MRPTALERNKLRVQGVGLSDPAGAGWFAHSNELQVIGRLGPHLASKFGLESAIDPWTAPGPESTIDRCRIGLDLVRPTVCIWGDELGSDQ